MTFWKSNYWCSTKQTLLAMADGGSRYSVAAHGLDPDVVVLMLVKEEKMIPRRS